MDEYSYHIWRAWYIGSHIMMAKPIKALELHYPMIQFLIKWGMHQVWYLKSWTSESKLFQTRFKIEIPCWGRWEEWLRCSKLKWAFLLYSDIKLFMYLIRCSLAHEKLSKCKKYRTLLHFWEKNEIVMKWEDKQ